MNPLYLEILLQLKTAEIFGNIPVIEKNKINYVQYKNISIDTKNHHNNLIGKVVCKNFKFYYIPLKFIDNYDQSYIGIPICSNIDICPFCFGIQLDIDKQYKYYKIMKEHEYKEDHDSIIFNDISNDISNDIYKILKKKFCFEIINNK